MKKNLLFGRILCLVMTMFLVGGINTTLNAQKSDGFFRGGENDDIYTDRIDPSGMSLGNAEYQNPTPLGSGLMIMVAAGAGYAVARRKRIAKLTKKSSALLLAFALVLGMTQCKKSPVTPTNNNNGVHITLNATYGGDKTVFNPATCGFAWSATEEYINVGGSKGGYLGQLRGTGNGSETTIEFSGTLDKDPTDGEKLYFFYLGNGDHHPTSSAIQYIDFSNQNGNLGSVTDYHIAISDGVVYDGQETFSATLNMKIAIAYFNTSGASGEDVYLRGDKIYKKIGLNYMKGTFDVVEEKGLFCIPAGSDGYVALIPSTDSETTLKFDSNSKTGTLTFLYGIKAGYYYANGNEGLSIPFESVSDDAVKGLFTVSSNNKIVRFAKGNLQYTRTSTDVDWSTGSWSFMTNQYDVLETANVSDNYSSQTAIGLFGWGTSGWNNGNLCYLPNSTSNLSTGDYVSSKGYGYGPTDGSKYNFPLTETYANADWGVFNSSAITNGGGYNTWYTLSSTEWGYLLNTRSASTINTVDNARFVRANVHGKNGIVLFPDSFSYPTEEGFPVPVAGNINKTSWSNVYLSYTNDQWETLENKGVVFLPIAGRRNGTSYSDSSNGYYYTTSNNGSDKAYYVTINNSVVNASNSDKRCYGCSVRLVRDVE